MSGGVMYIVSSLSGALLGWTLVRRSDAMSVGLGVATGVACGFSIIEHNAWYLLPAAMLLGLTWIVGRARRSHG